MVMDESYKIDMKNLSKSQIKKKISKNFVKNSGINPETNTRPIAVILAGIPGSGKTEFISSLFTDNKNFKQQFLRIDLDEIVKIFKDYSPENDYKFRPIGNAIVENIFDKAIAGNYNFVLDGTFGSSKAIFNIKRLIKHDYFINIYIMVESAERAWNFTKIRELKTKRKIKKDDFLESIKNVKDNLKELEKIEYSSVSIRFVDKSWINEEYNVLDEFDIDELYLE